MSGVPSHVGADLEVGPSESQSRNRPLHAILIPFVIVSAAALAVAQPATRRATHVAALLAFPNFFHGQQVILHGQFVDVGESRRFRAAEGEDSLQALGKVGAPGTFHEIRAEFVDVGRYTKDEARLSRDLADAIERQFGDRWPKPGEALVLNVLSSQPSGAPSAPTVRTVALEPGRYKDQRVTVSGQFRGRNLYGDLPSSPGVSKWDFVIKVADAAVWVANLRPKGKDIDLDPAARVDTGRWVEVSGVVQVGRGLVWLDGARGTFAAARPIVEETRETTVERTVGPPPEVIFSVPAEGEGDVAQATSVRLQFSRDLDPTSIKGQVRVAYSTQEATERGEPAPPPVEFTSRYVDANRMIEVKFAKPLDRFRTVRVELGDGIKARDGAPLKPFTLTFMTGGS